MHLPCSAVLAHIILKEKLNIFGILGCVLCITGSLTIVLHAPEERPLESVLEVWSLALQPGACTHTLVVKLLMPLGSCLWQRGCTVTGFTISPAACRKGEGEGVYRLYAGKA
jgi:hypothetical protein